MLNKGDLEFFKGQIESIEKEQKEITEDIRDSYIEANKSVEGFLVDKYKEDLLDLVKGSKDKDEYFKKKREYELKNNIGPCEAYWIADWTTLFYSKDNGDIKMIEEPSATFNDLIDVAVKAKKDGVLDEVTIAERDNLDCVVVSHDDNVTFLYTTSEIKHHIQYIRSLYTETFVIENESDTNKLISGGKTVLKNGEVLEFSNNYKGTLWFNLNDYESDTFPFVALKGATVTQRRGK